jgi:hypothetical protein
MLALAVLRLQEAAVPQIVPVDVELVRLISAWREQRDIIDHVRLISEWRRQRDIIDRTVVETAGILTFEESKPSEESLRKAMEAACDLTKQIGERAKAETWGGGPVSPLTLAVLAEIVLHHENGASNTLVDTAEYYMDQKATAELMVAVLSFARSAGAGSDLLPMEGRICLPPCLREVATMAKHCALPLRNAQVASRKIAHKPARKSARRTQKVAELVRPPEEMFPEILELPFCKYVGRPPGEDQCDWWSVPLDPKDSLDAEMLGRHYAC